MKKYVVIGDPIKHSLSPVMHNAGFAELKINARYEIMHVKLENLAEFADFARNNLAGFNVTVPHKQKIIPYLDEISDVAKLANSVNTVTVTEDKKLIGTSTDGYGLEMGIKTAFNVDLKNNIFSFLGCGGAVQAVAFHFAENDAKQINIINRTESKAKDLTIKLKQTFPNLIVNYSSLENQKKITDILKISNVLIQGTSLGLSPDDKSPIPEEYLSKNLFVYDTIYKNTKFFKIAKNKGLKTANGSSMLLYQGAKAFSIWTHKTAPIDVMKKGIYSVNPVFNRKEHKV